MGHGTWLFETVSGVRGAGGVGGAFSLLNKCLLGTYYVLGVTLSTGLKHEFIEPFIACRPVGVDRDKELARAHRRKGQRGPHPVRGLRPAADGPLRR